MARWEDFIEPHDERLIAIFHHKKRRLTTVLGMTEKRSFVFQKRKMTQERFASSKLPISSMEYSIRKLAPWQLGLIGIFCLILLISGGSMVASYSYLSRTMGGVVILGGLVILALAIYFRQMATIIAYIGKERVVLRSRTGVNDIVGFIRIVHSYNDLHKKGYAGGLGPQLAMAKKAGAVIIGLLLIYFVLSPLMLLAF